MKVGWQSVSLPEAVEINPFEPASPPGQPRRRVMLEHLYGWRKRLCGSLFGDEIQGGARFRNGDVLVARISPSLENGKTALVDNLDPDEVASGSTELIVLRARPEVLDPIFLYYLAISPHFRHLLRTSLTGTTGRLRVPSHILQRICFRLPPASEQRRLALLLSRFDERIELNHSIIDKLAELHKQSGAALFQQCLPADAGGPARTCGEELLFKEILRSRHTYCHPSETLEYAVSGDGVYPRQNKVRLSASNSGRQCKVAHQHDLVFGMSRDALNWGMMPAVSGGVSKAYHVFSIDHDKINPLFLEGFMRACDTYFRDILKPASREGQCIDSGQLLCKRFYPPAWELQDRYAGVIGKITEKRSSCRQENAILLSLRDDLLRRHFSEPAGFCVQPSQPSGSK